MSQSNAKHRMPEKSFKHVEPAYRRESRIQLPFQWMHWVLKIAGVYNIVAGLSMMIFYHEGFKLLGVEKPEFAMPIQLVGLLVAIFGIGYLIVDRRPQENRNVLLLGLLSKFLGPVLAISHIALGNLPIAMLVVLFFADGIYLIPFWIIYRHLCATQKEES